MKITLCNFKGGVGKSLIAHQLITGFNFNGLELDPYGSLSQRLPDRVKKISIKEQQLPELLPEEPLLFDFGGFDDIKLQQACSMSNLVVIPFIPTLESVQGTLRTLQALKDVETPFLLVSNMGQKTQDIQDALVAFQEQREQKLEHFVLPLSVALQTAVNENTSVLTLARGNSLKAYAYQKAATLMQDLYDKIVELSI